MERLALFAASSTDLLSALWRASWQGALVIAAVWLLCRFRPLPAAARCALWWLASLKLLLDLASLPAVPLPLLPPAEVPELAVPAVDAAPRASIAVLPAAPPGPPARSAPASPRFPWQAALLGLWALGVAVQGGWLVREHLRLRGIRRQARPVRDPEAVSLFAGLVRRLGLSREPLLLESAAIASPQAVGFVAPAILLPQGAAADLAPADLEMALCHELAHLSRRDLWLGWVPAVAERLFFFHPLVALAAREYALAREAACDAEVLDRLGAAPRDYGRLLLKLGVAPRAAVGAAAGASSSWMHLKRRLLMLQETTSDATPRRSRAWIWLAVPVALLALIPLQLVRADDPAAVGAEGKAGELAVAAATPAPSSSKSAVVAEAAEVTNLQGATHTEYLKERTPLLAGYKDGGTISPWSNASYVLTRGSDSTVMNGTRDELRTARKLREDWDSDVILFTRDGKTYAIRDAATVARAQALFAPQEELGEKQSALGERQSALGEEQSKLGEQQAKLGEQMAELAERHWREHQGEGGEALESRMSELEAKMEELGRMQEALGVRQEELGEKQQALGERQEKLAAEAEKKLDALIDEARKNGLAQEVER